MAAPTPVERQRSGYRCPARVPSTLWLPTRPNPKAIIRTPSAPLPSPNAASSAALVKAMPSSTDSQWSPKRAKAGAERNTAPTPAAWIQPVSVAARVAAWPSASSSNGNQLVTRCMASMEPANAAHSVTVIHARCGANSSRKPPRVSVGSPAAVCWRFSGSASASTGSSSSVPAPPIQNSSCQRIGAAPQCTTRAGRLLPTATPLSTSVVHSELPRRGAMSTASATALAAMPPMPMPASRRIAARPLGDEQATQARVAMPCSAAAPSSTRLRPTRSPRRPNARAPAVMPSRCRVNAADSAGASTPQARTSAGNEKLRVCSTKPLLAIASSSNNNRGTARPSLRAGLSRVRASWPATHSLPRRRTR